jgi:predicted transcriptional regulator
MRKPLDDALEAAHDVRAAVALSTDERAAIATSKAAAARGEFATDEQVRAIWAKHDL